MRSLELRSTCPRCGEKTIIILRARLFEPAVHEAHCHCDGSWSVAVTFYPRDERESW